MSSTAAKDWRAEYREFCGATLEEIARPRCHRTKQTLGERAKASNRKAARVARKEARSERRTKYVPKRRTLTRLEQIRLHDGTIDLKSIRGCKLTSCDRKRVRELKKQQPPKHAKAAKAPRAALKRDPREVVEIDGSAFELFGMTLILLTLDNSVRFELVA